MFLTYIYLFRFRIALITSMTFLFFSHNKIIFFLFVCSFFLVIRMGFGWWHMTTVVGKTANKWNHPLSENLNKYLRVFCIMRDCTLNYLYMFRSMVFFFFLYVRNACMVHDDQKYFIRWKYEHFTSPFVVWLFSLLI